MPIGRFVFIVSIKSHSTLSSLVIICNSFFEQWFSGRIGELGRFNSDLYLLKRPAWSGESRSSLDLRAILCSSGMISSGSVAFSIGNSSRFLEDGKNCLFSNEFSSRDCNNSRVSIYSDRIYNAIISTVFTVIHLECSLFNKNF